MGVPHTSREKKRSSSSEFFLKFILKTSSLKCLNFLVDTKFTFPYNFSPGLKKHWFLSKIEMKFDDQNNL